jgi:hypothetical protein
LYISQRLKWARKLPGVTPEIIADVIGVTPRYILDMTGKASERWPKQPTRKILRAIYDLPIDRLRFLGARRLAALWMRCLRAQGHDCQQQAHAYNETPEWVAAVCDGQTDLLTRQDVAAVHAYAKAVLRSARIGPSIMWGGNLVDAEYAAEQGWLPLACYDDDGTFRGRPAENYLRVLSGGAMGTTKKVGEVADRIVQVIELTLEGRNSGDVAEMVGVSRRSVLRYLERTGLHFRVASFTAETGTQKRSGVIIEPEDSDRTREIRQALAEYRGLPEAERDAVAFLDGLDIPVILRTAAAEVPVSRAA